MTEQDNPLRSFGKAAQKKSRPTEEQLTAKEKEKLRKDDDKEIQKMLDRMDVMRREIEQKLEYIVRISGWTREQLWSFISNQDNFSKDQWELVQKENKAFVDRVWSVIGPNFPKNSSPPASTTPSSSTPHTKNPSKAKTIGARRNWIQMH